MEKFYKRFEDRSKKIQEAVKAALAEEEKLFQKYLKEERLMNERDGLDYTDEELESIVSVRMKSNPHRMKIDQPTYYNERETDYDVTDSGQNIYHIAPESFPINYRLGVRRVDEDAMPLFQRDVIAGWPK